MNGWSSKLVDSQSPLEEIARTAGPAVAWRGYVARPDDEGDAVPAALVTGLERVCSDDPAKAHLREFDIMREFARRMHHYLPHTPPASNSLELLALMQHHGAPTRLLDWTYSLYVAAHFALFHASRRPGADLAIWAINPAACRDGSANVCGGETTRLWEGVRDSEDDKRAGELLLSGRLRPSVWPVNPFRLNERLTIQQGLFLAVGDVSRSFLENLAKLQKLPVRPEVDLRRYVIRRKHSSALAAALYRMNVTEATLFPGLDGFARSLWSLPPDRRQ